MTTPDAGYDVTSLAARLRREQRGTVRDDTLARALYGTDASNYRVVPDAIVLPRTEDDLVTTLALAREAGAPVAMRGAGTSMAGNALGGVVIDCSRHLNAILDVDPAGRTAIVQPGVVLADLLAAVEPHGLAFGADPSSASRCTLGGMIGNNACGAHSVAWGTTAANLRGLRVVTGAGDPLDLRVPDGPRGRPDLTPGPGAALHLAHHDLAVEHADLIRARFGTFARQISGYDLEHLLPERGVDLVRLLCGSEGTLASTLTAELSLVEQPSAVVLLALGFPDAVAAADSVPILLPHRPLTVESINATLVDRLPAEVRAEAVAAGLPRGPPGCWSNSGRTTPGRPVRSRPRSPGPSATASRARPRPSSATRPRRRCCGAAAATGRGWRPGARTAPRPGPAGRTPPSRPNGSASTCADWTSCSPGTATRGPRTGTSARAACTCGSTST